MPVTAEVYRSVAVDAEPSSGDIAFLSLARTRASGEGPPGEIFDSTGRVPAYPTPSLFPLPHNREIALDAIFALVVTHSCEIDRQRNAGAGPDHWDCRIAVAPIVPEPRVQLVSPGGISQSVSWTAIEANAPVGSLFLPAVGDLSAIDPSLRADRWPRGFADLRGLATVSRQMVRVDRLMGLMPAYVGVLQRQLARFFTWRDLARHEAVEALVGRRIVSALPVNARRDRLHVALTADDGSSLTVEMRTR